MPIVTSDNEVSLNALYYKIRGDVQKSIGSNFARKTVIGDFTTESREGVSVIKWNDLLGGIGLERISSPQDNTRGWYGELVTRYPGHLFSAPLRVPYTGESGTAVKVPPVVHENSIVAVDTAGVVRAATDALFGSTLDTLPAAPTDALAFSFNNSGSSINQVIWPHDTGYTYTSDLSSFTDSTDDVTYVTQWDDRIWFYDENAGTLSYVFAMGDAPNIVLTVSNIPKDQVLGLFTGPDASGEDTLYMVTTRGLLAFDAPNERLVKTPFDFAYPLKTGAAVDRAVHAISWRGDIYVPWGGTLMRYSPTARPATIISIGPSDRWNGVKDGKGAPIRQLIATSQYIFAGLDGPNASSTTATATSIWAWDGQQWSVMRLGPSDVGVVMHVGAEVNDELRLSWFESANAHFKVLASELNSPLNIAGFEYDSGGEMFYPWFHVGSDVDGIALRVHADVSGAEANVGFTVAFAVNDSTSFSSLGNIITNGTTTFEFPNSSTPTGTAFKNIQFKVSVTSNSSTKTPDLLSLTFEYEQKLPVRYQYSFIVDVRETHKRRTTKTMLEDLEAAVGAKTKVEFNYKGADPDLPEYVDIVSIQAVEKSGFTEEGFWQVTVVDR